MFLEKIKPPKKEKKKEISNFLLDELNIYNQAELFKSKNEETQIFFNQKNGFYKISFNLSGDLNGVIICSLKFSDLDAHFENTKYVKDLFQEAMNLLLGHFLTNLEEETGLMSIISSPRSVNHDTHEKVNSPINFKTHYMLMTALYELPLEIMMYAHKRTAGQEV